MAQTTATTDYSSYQPFPDGRAGIRNHSSALGQLFTDTNNLQTDVLEFTGAIKTVASLTQPYEFIKDGWGSGNHATGLAALPDPTLVPVLYVLEGGNYWIAPNDPDNYDLGDGATPSTGVDWFNFSAGGETYASDEYASLVTANTTSTSAVDIDAANLNLTLDLNGGFDVLVVAVIVGETSNTAPYGIWSVDADGTDYTLSEASEQINGRRYNANGSRIISGLSAGSRTFKLRHRVSASTTVSSDVYYFGVRELP